MAGEFLHLAGGLTVEETPDAAESLVVSVPQ
jgi:hypothetical protein